jgi:protein-S-isoprenylcysteine O-methyltransferase Ste14
VDSVEILLLMSGTLLLLAATWWISLRGGRYHGVYRFFSFESIFVLCLLNWRFWFFEPLSWNQIISWTLLCGSVVPAAHGFYVLRMVGKPEGQFENTTKLVRVGPYRFIRHPLYASLILLGTGVCFKHLSWLTLGLAGVNVFAMIATARFEEKEMLEKFGQEYDVYMQETKMFIPFLF